MMKASSKPEKHSLSRVQTQVGKVKQSSQVISASTSASLRQPRKTNRSMEKVVTNDSKASKLLPQKPVLSSVDSKAPKLNCTAQRPVGMTGSGAEKTATAKTQIMAAEKPLVASICQSPDHDISTGSLVASVSHAIPRSLLRQPSPSQNYFYRGMLI